MIYKITQTSVDSDNDLLVKYDELVDWLRITPTQDEALVKALIKQAHARVEELANMDIVTRAYSIYLPSYVKTVDLSKANTVITGIQYKKDGVLTIFDTSNVFHANSVVTFINTPGDADDGLESIVLSFNVVPQNRLIEQAKICIKMLVANWYDNRSDSKYAVPSVVESMVGNFRYINN